MLFLFEYPSLDYPIQMKCRIDKVWQMPTLAGAGFIFRSFGPEGKITNGCISDFVSWGIGIDRAAFMNYPAGGNWQILGHRSIYRIFFLETA